MSNVIHIRNKSRENQNTHDEGLPDMLGGMTELLTSISEGVRWCTTCLGPADQELSNALVKLEEACDELIEIIGRDSNREGA